MQSGSTPTSSASVSRTICRGLIAGDVRCDDVFLQLFASDASIYEIKPLAVVRPRSTADVAACVQYAAENRIPVHARGAGTGVAGASLGAGLIVDFSAYLRRVVRIDGPRVRVQPGVVHERLNAQLPEARPAFGAGPRGQQRHHDRQHDLHRRSGQPLVEVRLDAAPRQSMQIVLADGQVLEVGREPLVDGAGGSAIPRKRDLVTQVAALLRKKAELIRQNQPRSPLSHCGYNLADVMNDESIDVARLLVGSQGTLALITEALAQHRLAAAASRRGAAVVRQLGKGGAERARYPAARSDGMRPHGPAAFEPCPRGRSRVSTS